ncbi:MAG: radical SAM protein, partial [Oscillospiraceae bacterium]|nr:radical SAM protein [Oscillospiraceae bacterium]
MQDLFDRNIDYLRISITDRCNLRCKYCMPEALADIPHDLILRYEEILRICAIMSKLGITTVKVTGGEPFVRRGCMDFIKRLKQIPGIE